MNGRMRVLLLWLVLKTITWMYINKKYKHDTPPIMSMLQYLAYFSRSNILICLFLFGERERRRGKGEGREGREGDERWGRGGRGRGELGGRGRGTLLFCIVDCNWLLNWFTWTEPYCIYCGVPWRLRSKFWFVRPSNKSPVRFWSVCNEHGKWVLSQIPLWKVIYRRMLKVSVSIHSFASCFFVIADDNVQ